MRGLQYSVSQSVSQSVTQSVILSHNIKWISCGLTHQNVALDILSPFSVPEFFVSTYFSEKAR